MLITMLYPLKDFEEANERDSRNRRQAGPVVSV